MQHHISIDLETYSSVPIKTAGAHAYIDSPDFQILLFAYSIDGGAVKVIDFTDLEGSYVDMAVAIATLDNPDFIKHAYNAAFEWACLSKYLGKQLPPEQWRDTMLHGLYCGYPAGLDAVGRALGLPEDKQKLNTGKALIRYFCVPCKPSKVNGGRTRNYPGHDPDKWNLFKTYNAQDVVTEMEVENRLSAFPVPDFVQKQWETDLIINARGVAVDMPFVRNALQMGYTVSDTLKSEAIAISNLDNPNSVKQLTEWLSKETGEQVDNLQKTTVAKMLNSESNSSAVNRMLEIRQELGKTSIKKYDALEECYCSDGRVRGLLQFYGANRTGRWAGRLVQVQNLPRTYLDPLDLARDLVKSNKLDALKTIYGSPNDTLSQLIRTAFVASDGNVLIDADFSAIEARVIAWLAGEEWRLDVFRNGGDIYCASASQMFHCRVVKGGENGHLRQKGKIAELALGYGGSQGALVAMGALDMGIPEEELPDMVTRWREANPRITALWYAFDSAAQSVISNGGEERVAGCVFAREYDYSQNMTYFTILLPSGRKLFYVNPSLGENRWGNPSILYEGVNQTTKKWQQIETFGGKIVENVVQAIARDCLAQAIEKLEDAGLPVVFHVHDEVVIDVKPWADNDEMLHKVVSIMSEPIPWAQGLPLNADGWVGQYFKKD
ncbi:MAG: DNA polymerase [Clostridia bacterium]|nr:DNA polymerase [Clostridia bacterium]